MTGTLPVDPPRAVPDNPSVGGTSEATIAVAPARVGSGRVGAVIDGATAMVGCLVPAVLAVGYRRVVVHRPGAAGGDSELAAEPNRRG